MDYSSKPTCRDKKDRNSTGIQNIVLKILAYLIAYDVNVFIENLPHCRNKGATLQNITALNFLQNINIRTLKHLASM